MKSILVLAALALSAFAQQATIVTPTAGSNITGGSAITIEVHQDVRRRSLPHTSYLRCSDMSEQF